MAATKDGADNQLISSILLFLVPHSHNYEPHYRNLPSGGSAGSWLKRHRWQTSGSREMADTWNESGRLESEWNGKPGIGKV